MLKKIIIIFFLTSLWGCKQKTDYTTYRLGECYTLHGEKLSVWDTVHFSYPSQLTIHDGDIYVGDLNAKNEAVFRFRLDNFSLVGKYGIKGKANNEYVTFDNFQFVDNNIYLWDVASSKFLIYDLDNNYNTKVKKISPSGSHLQRATIINDTLLAYGDTHSKRLISFQTDAGQLVDSISLQYKTDQQSKEGMSANQLYSMNLRYDPSSSTLVGGSTIGDMIMIYHTDQKYPKILVGPGGFPDFSLINNHPVIMANKGYKDILLKDNKIYGLYCDMPIKEYMEAQFEEGHTIHVFDVKKAEYLYSYQLDSDLCAFDIDLESNTLYGLSSKDFSLIKYSLVH